MSTPLFRRVDMERDPRRAHYHYFKDMAYPYVGLTCNVDITRFLAAVKANGTPFFLTFLWHAAEAANAVPAFRQRMDAEGVVEFAHCDTSHTVAKPDGTYGYCRLDSCRPLEAYIPYARERQQAAVIGGDIEESAEEGLSLLFISTLPWLSYTALVQPTPCPADSNPRITWGKFFAQGDRMWMPVSVLCNHALVDGRHIADFFALLQGSIHSEDGKTRTAKGE